MEDEASRAMRPKRLRFSLAQAQSSLVEPPDNNDSIIVYARIKPPISGDDNFLVYDEHTVRYDELDKRGRQRTLNFSFHKVFKPNTNQEDIYFKTVDKDIEMFVKGHNRLLFSYGTTGSGKTFTIFGTTKAPGILPRCTVKLFMSIQYKMDLIYLCPDQGCDLKVLSDEDMVNRVGYKDLILSLVENIESDETLDLNDSDLEFKINTNDYQEVINQMEDIEGVEMDLSEVKYSVWVSYLEVYNENIYDLLDVNIERKPLKLGMDSEKNNFVKGLTHVLVENWMEMWKVFLYGRARVHMNQTQLNKNSSRSHSVFTLKVIKDVKNHKPTITSLTICDLAGTERQKKALISGDKLKESKHINTSLMILNRCFSIVRENKTAKAKKIAPYRESKLTQIFQKAFSYNERITMFVNLSLSNMLAEETKNVLKMSAVAQEMVKSMPTKTFLKPNSRFSMMCQLVGNKAPSVSGISGVFTMTNSTMTLTSNISDELQAIKVYQDQIKGLENDLKSAKDEIKSLMETLDDARNEFLNLEKKYMEQAEHLAEEEAVNDELEKELEDLQMIADSKTSTIQSLEGQLEKVKDINNQISMDVAKLEEENEQILGEKNKILEDKNHEIQKLKEENEMLLDKIKKLEAEKDKPRRKGLLKTLDPIDRWSQVEIKENLDVTKDTSVMNNTRTPRSTRKTKPNYLE